MALVEQLARVLFHVDAEQPHAPQPAAGGDLYVAAGGQRPLVLRDLVALGQVRVEVVLAREDRGLADGAVRGQGGAQGQAHGLAAQHGQRAGQPQADRADVGVGVVAEAVAAGAEDLGRGL